MDASAPAFLADLTVAPGLRLALASKPDSALTSIAIARSGTASVSLMVLSDGPVTAGSLTASNLGLDDPAIFQPVTFQPPPVPPTPSVDSAAFRDLDCDGKAEAVRIWFKKDLVRRLKDSIQVKTVTVKLPFSSQSILASGTKVVDADSSILDVALTTPVPGTTPVGNFSIALTLKRLSLGDTVVNALGTGNTDTVFGIRDRVGPRLTPRALIWENATGNPHDTLRIITSEPISFSGTQMPLMVLAGGVWKSVTASVASQWYGTTRDTLYLDITGNAGQLAEKSVVRLDPAAALVDASGNHADDCAGATDTLLAWVKPVPMVAASIVDINGDGAPDQIHVRFAATLAKPAHFPDSLVVDGWCDFCGTRSFKLTPSADGIQFSADIAPFAVGQTSGKGLNGAGTITFRGPMLVQTIDLVDSVGPIPTNAVLRYGKGSDTLKVNFSEPVTALAAGTWLMHQSGAALTLDPMASASGTSWSFAVASNASPYPNVGDSVYLANSGSRLVGQGGVIPTSVVHPPRVVVQGGDRAPDSGVVLDRNGDGTADAVRLHYASPLKGNPVYTFTWGGVPVTVDSTTYGVAKDSLTLTIPVKGFPAMVTSDPSAVGGSQSLVAGQLDPALPFRLVDGVAPAIDSVMVTYGLVEGSPDTLRVWTTEPIGLPSVNGFLALDRKGVRLPFQATDRSATVTGSGPYTIICTECTDSVGVGFGLPGWGDLGRLQKGLVDMRGNQVGDSSVWVPVYTGVFPTRYRASVYPKPVLEVQKSDDNHPLKGLAPVSAFLIPDALGDNAVWTPVGTTKDDAAKLGFSQGVLQGDAKKIFEGVVIEMNTSFDGDFLAYDNLGVFVGRQSLKIDMDGLKKDGLLPPSAKKFRLAILMNGSNMVGKPVSDGVYMIRMIGYGKQMVNGKEIRVMIENKIFKFGYKHAK